MTKSVRTVEVSHYYTPTELADRWRVELGVVNTLIAEHKLRVVGKNSAGQYLISDGEVLAYEAKAKW